MFMTSKTWSFLRKHNNQNFIIIPTIMIDYGLFRIVFLCLKILLLSHILDDIKRSQLFKDMILSS